jgi:hypothetical protein
MKRLIGTILCATVLVAAPAFAQAPAKSADTKSADTKAPAKSADTNMQILRDKIKADKKLVVAANMQLSDAESKAFWPLYDGYQGELKTLNERLAKTVLAYADAYNAKTLTDDKAKALLDESIAIDESEVKMRRDYAAKLTKAIPAMKAARYLQIENKIRALIRYELASGIPLVE